MLISKEKIEIASSICKVDLMSDLVGEFPELQGIMGGYFAEAQGFDKEISYLLNQKSHVSIPIGSCLIWISDFDIVSYGKKVRYSEKYKKHGVNVNLAQFKEDKIIIQTYERGVENETLSCGTGAIATAIALNYSDIDDSNEIKISMKGGDLSISFDRIGEDFSNICKAIKFSHNSKHFWIGLFAHMRGLCLRLALKF